MCQPSLPGPTATLPPSQPALSPIAWKNSEELITGEDRLRPQLEQTHRRLAKEAYSLRVKIVLLKQQLERASIPLVPTYHPRTSYFSDITGFDHNEDDTPVVQPTSLSRLGLEARRN